MVSPIRGCCNLTVAQIRGPTDDINIRILNSGSKAQYSEDTANHFLQDPYASVVFWGRTVGVGAWRGTLPDAARLLRWPARRGTRRSHLAGRLRCLGGGVRVGLLGFMQLPRRQIWEPQDL